MTHPIYNRRRFLKTTATTAMAAGAGSLLYRQAQAQTGGERKFLFIIAAGGGASIVDSLLPQLTGPSAYTEAQLEQPNGSNFRAPIFFPENSILDTVLLGDNYPISNFLSKHAADTAVITQTVSSVNHNVGALRNVIGNGANGGLSLQEVFTMRWGQGLAMANVGMSSEYYNGITPNASSPAWARAQSIADPRSFALTTHGYKGLSSEPSSSTIDRARTVRAKLEKASPFARRFGQATKVLKYQQLRSQALSTIEDQDVISKLLLAASSPVGQANSQFNLTPSADTELLQSKFPNLGVSPFEAQAALAYLLVKNGLSSAVTISPSSTPTFLDGVEQARALNSPISFDWSHVDHRSAQNSMWSRMFQVTDALIDLLKTTEYENGKSMWDQSLIYMPTEFGRDRVSSGGSGHALNNGVVCISPLLKGNQVYGGVDANTGLTYGFDPATGAPSPGTNMTESDVYSLICHATDVSFSGRRDFPAVVRG